MKGVEPFLYECLASTLRQDYPRDKLTTYICVSTREDPSFPILEKVVEDFANRCDVRIFVEEEDPLLQEGSTYPLGPNPKIRNMSRAYREAKGDIIWIIDCNVWVGTGVCGRMVDKLCGYGSGNGKRYKFVHHLPLAVNVDDAAEALPSEAKPLLANGGDGHDEDTLKSVLKDGGGRLEELFLSSSHAKMYTAINTVLIAPCIVGKSNMFRRSHLNDLTTTPNTGGAAPATTARNPGIDWVSDQLCEDHIIGDWLWRNKVREEREPGARPLGKHTMVFGDYAFQPVASMSVKAYIARRVRWLRVRKYTVLAATLVEPGTESIVCSLYGAFGVSTVIAKLLQQSHHHCLEEVGSYLQQWPSFFLLWFTSMFLWCLIDWTLYVKLHSAATVEVDAHTPVFAKSARSASQLSRRPFLHWLAAWITRELLAFPIWAWAVYGGSTVTWRSRSFQVSIWDTKAREVNQLARSRVLRGVDDASYSSSRALRTSSSSSSSSSSVSSVVSRTDKRGNRHESRKE